MKYKELIEHILGNSKNYVKEYKKKTKLNDMEKGLLEGLWIDLDSIVNQLIIENIEVEDNITLVMEELRNLIDNK